MYLRIFEVFSWLPKYSFKDTIYLFSYLGLGLLHVMIMIFMSIEAGLKVLSNEMAARDQD